MKGDPYNPNPKNAAMMNTALEIVNALPYIPTTRYVFYRLHALGLLRKNEYKRFLQHASKARHWFWNGWDPDTFVDDTRSIQGSLGGGYNYDDLDSWLDNMADESPVVDSEDFQDNLVIIAFEAKAMVGQFNHYLGGWRIPMTAFGGDASIALKSQIRDMIENAHAQWPDKPIVVLYFGDYDPKGMEIPINAMRHIRNWTEVEFEFVRIGLDLHHISQYDIEDNPESPGKYQWEAVPDEAAKEIISRVFEWWSKDAVKKARRREDLAARVWSDHVQPAIDAAKEALQDETAEDRDGDEDLDHDTDEEGSLWD